MPAPLPPGAKGSTPADLEKGPEGLPGGEFVRMPSIPKDPLTGQRNGPVSSAAPPGVAPPLHN